MPPVGRYPASLAEINYGIRWFKTKSTELDSRPDRVGALGVWSGRHQAMLTAMRPDDARFAALSSPSIGKMDAMLRCVVLCWPVIDLLGRYQYVRNQ